MAAEKLVQMNLLEPLEIKESDLKQFLLDKKKDQFENIDITEDSKDMFSDPIKLEKNDSSKKLENNFEK